MFVQDIKSPELNITAELMEEEVDNFKELCKMFAFTTLHEQLIDEYLLKLSQVRSTNLALNVNNAKKPAYEFSETSLSSLQKFKNEMAKKKHENIDAETSSTLNHSDVNTGAKCISISTEKLEDVINVDEITKFTRIETNEILSRSSTRIDSEKEIIDKFSFLLMTFDPDIIVTPFGSVTFGFGGQRTNFNILITSGKFNFTMAEIWTIHFESFNCFDTF